MCVRLMMFRLMMFRLMMLMKWSVCVSVLLGGAQVCAGEGGAYHTYIGTYTRGDPKGNHQSRGIYLARFDAAKGSLMLKGLAAASENPSFLAIHPSGTFLYAVNEIGDYEGTAGGAVSAFRIDPSTGGLTFINQVASRGPAPCHLVVDKTGRYVLLANYNGGNVAVLPIGKDGALSEPSCVVTHPRGSGVNKRRQQEAHAHSIVLNADNTMAVASDLGADRLFVYRFDAGNGQLDLKHEIATQPGGGPRHFAWHPNGRDAYSNNELTATVATFRADAEGRLRSRQLVSTLPEGFEGRRSTAEILVHPAGRFVYCSNRGHDSIAVFQVDASESTLTPVTHQKTGGREPRNFFIEPGGRFLLAANQNSETVVVFTIDPTTGALKPNGWDMTIPRPVCVRMRPVED